MTDVPSSDRYLSLDALRGIAVMGILAMNIVAFAMPSQAYINPRAYGDAAPLDMATWAFNFILVDGKMRGLFSVLFGASMLLVIDRAEAQGASAASTHYRRMAWLLLFGALHFYLVWFGDILFLYAAIGMIAFLFRARPPRSLWRWAIGLFVTNFLLFAAFALSLHALRHGAGQPGAPAELITQWRELQNQIGAPGAPAIARELAVYSGGYGGILDFRTSAPAALMPIIGLFFFGFETLGLMLMGMALFRTGFLTGEWDSARYRRWMTIGYALGLPAMAVLAWWVWSSGFDAVTTFGAAQAWAAPWRIALILAHAALALLLIRRFAASAIMRRIAAAGRVAFSNYLGTSLVMTAIFYGYGLGLFGEVSRATLYLFVIGMWAVMLLWSKPWLERFRHGPLEWLWRSLSRGGAQPMRL